jgi:hypothetical protein
VSLDVCEEVPVFTVAVFAAAGVKIGRLVKPRTLGVCEIDVARLVQMCKLHGEIGLFSKHRKTAAGFISLELEFEPIAEPAKMSFEVPNS